jgi:dTDP-4-dehydrorhamnose reductase
MGLYDSILVTGGRGMLAHAFRSLLADRGANATFASREECGVGSMGSLLGCFEKVRPSLVINCAAYTKVDLAEREYEAAVMANGVGATNVGALCRQYGAALVHFSTDYVFDGSARRPWRPDDPVSPRSAYGRSKLMGEQGIQSNHPEHWLIVRTAWLYGPNGPNFAQTMLNVARAGKPLRVVNDQVGSPTYTFDLAEAALDLLDRGATGIWHVSNSGQTTWFDFARAIFEEWGLSPDLQPITSAEWKATKPDSATRPAYSVFDLGPLEKLLGRGMRPWREALRAYHDRVNAE